jgi:hypothetical protein
VVLFSLGTGPVKGFAITLSIGILTSMFTAIFGSRVLVRALYGGRRLNSLPIYSDSHAKSDKRYEYRFHEGRKVGHHDLQCTGSDRTGLHSVFVA